MNSFKVPLVTSSTQIKPDQFWNAVMLYHNRPHLVNRKLLAASQVLFYNISLPNKDVKQIQELFTKSAVLYEMRQLQSITKENLTQQFIKNIVDCYHKNLELLETNESEFNEQNNGFYISVRILLPRNKSSEQCIEVVFLNKNNNIASFLAVSEPKNFPCAPTFNYDIELSNNCNLKINLNSFEDADTPSAEWLADNLFPKLLKWSEQDKKVCLKTLSLIAVDEYSLVYSKLKQLYANDLIKKWPTKTSTDPQKYVFEDLAIASYLICLWKHCDPSRVNFVDCGCGNGLLVFILNQEGFKGYGIDIRKRPIWEIYPQEIILMVDTVSPDSTFPESTWIIGNHSDELTPWIPVIALKSSPKTNFFVLPCCPYDFSGQKYIRENTCHSQYSDYMAYIQKISEKCGFETKIDKLRIPSTKKVCFVGYAMVSSDKREYLVNEIQQYIETRSAKKFTARSGIEKVRNCTQLNKDLLNKIVCDIVQLLLSTKTEIQKSNGDMWNRGSVLTIQLIGQTLGRDDLKQLKNECGGLQTLLRNHRYLFEVEKGSVQLRLPYKFTEVGEKYRNKLCWYFRNHVSGCYLSTEECAYMH